MGSIAQLVSFYREGGIHIATGKAELPELSGVSALPEVLVRTVVQSDGDVISQVAKALVEGAEYRTAMGKLLELHFEKVRKELPGKGRIIRFLEKWGRHLGIGTVLIGVLEQIRSGEFPDWATVAGVVSGVVLYFVRELLSWWFDRRIRKYLQMEAG